MSKESFDAKYNKAKVAGGWELRTSAVGVAEELEKLHNLMEKGSLRKKNLNRKKQNCFKLSIRILFKPGSSHE